MNILQVNYCDLPGRIFNGYDLQKSLNEQGINAKQLVLDKSSEDSHSLKMCTDRQLFIRSKLINIEREYGMFNLLEPFKDSISQLSAFKEADIVHYHIIHLYMISLLSMDYLFSQKYSVWTLHDPWALSGRCVHPLNCDKWKCGCYGCDRWNEAAFPTKIDKAHDLWTIKKSVFKRIKDKVDLVVASDWMLARAKESPITGQIKNIHKIPFGIKISDYEKYNPKQVREELGILPNNIVIGFRAELDPLKGTDLIIQALKNVATIQPITIITVGHMRLPEWLEDYYQVIESGWLPRDGVSKFLMATDIFVMPSLAESFGLMAIEAMASKCTVVVFEDTALEKVTHAPDCGVSVPYKSVEKLQAAIECLLLHPEERKIRGERGYLFVKENYRYEDYVHNHLELYNEIMQRKPDEEKKKMVFNFVEGLNIRRENIGEGIKRMQQLKREITEQQLNKEKENMKIAVVSDTEHGIRVYKEILEHLIPISYVVGKCNWKDINSTDSVKKFECISDLPDLLNTVVILADEETEKFYSDLDNKCIGRIILINELDSLLKSYPVIPEILQFKGIQDLDYSSEGMKKLIDLFNQTIESICDYYEHK